MVHGILQFTPSIAFRYVLHRCKSRDIRCRESFHDNTIRFPYDTVLENRPQKRLGSLARQVPDFVILPKKTGRIIPPLTTFIEGMNKFTGQIGCERQRQ